VSASVSSDQHGFILTRQWRDTTGGVELEYWLATAAGPVKVLVAGQQAVFFVADQQQAEASRLLLAVSGWRCKRLAMHDFSLSRVWAYYFNSQRTLREARELLFAEGCNPLEADINPQDRFLMERFVRGSMRLQGGHQGTVAEKFASFTNPRITASDYQPNLKILSLDIETAIHELRLYSIAVYAKTGSESFSKVFMVAEQPVSAAVEIFADDRQLLRRFLDWLADYDPDVIIGWNVINFDFWYLQQLCQKYRLPFSCGRGGRRATAHWRTLDDEGERRALSVPGRVILDGIELLKAAHYQFESFALNHVAKQILADEKLIQGSDRGEKITELFHCDKALLADYNVQDCKLVWGIFEQLSLIAFAVARSKITGLALDRVGGSVASFDFRYLPLLHRQGYVAPNGHRVEAPMPSPGGLVMNSQPGIYDFVAVLDFKSLYPSIIRSFQIDPLALAVGLGKELEQSELVPGFNGAWFARSEAILPGLIAELWQLRDIAKTRDDGALSQAIKIIMNSFYGVLGSGGCRFFDSRLASSITRRGHQIIQQTADFIERQGLSVIYGDTDSVFVWFSHASNQQQASEHARKLEQQLNVWWQGRLQKEYGIDSALEIEFETLYLRFLMPTVRGAGHGSKKRYAGVVMKGERPELVFKGLENVRSDWTRLARDFQLGLYQRVFDKQPYNAYIKALVAAVLNGEHDSVMVYRKRLRRKLVDYQRNIPPHVQAARKAAALGETIRRGDWIEYVITINGPEPVTHTQSQLDYQHYIDKQLAPVADAVLYFFEQSLAEIVDQQLHLFS
jgi:DNA polymerase-2